MKTKTEPRAVTEKPAEAPLVLHAQTARDIMTHNPVSLHASATTEQAAEFFYKRGVSAAPVITESGHPIGVLSLFDLVWYQRAKDGHFHPDDSNTKLKNVTRTVREIMTPAVFAVKPETPMRLVLEEMNASKVHRLFVIDHEGALIGVISAFDVVRNLVETPHAA